MTFHDVEFPLKFRSQTELGPSFRTNAHETGGGTRYASAQRTKPRHQFDVKPGSMTADDRIAFVNFYNARRGSLHSFKLTDPVDYSTHSDWQTAPTTSDGLVNLGSGDGSATQFQLKKVYSSGGYTTERPIVLPYASSVVVQVNSVTQTVTTNYTVNSLTGVVTFNTAPPLGHAVDAGCQFYVPVYFGIDLDRKLGIQGQRALATIGSIPMLELPNDLPVVDIGYGMGATDWTGSSLAANATFDVANGSTQVWKNTSGGGLKVILPSKDSLDLGAELRVKNDSASTSGITVRDEEATTDLDTIAAGSTAICILTLNSSSARQWVVVS